MEPGPTRIPRVVRRVAGRLRGFFSDPGQLLAVVLLGALVVRAVWLWLPEGSLIFDEAYYVNAARVVLGWTVPVDGHYAGSALGLDPNTEHPPLGKVLMALSMLGFGDNGLGWRFPSLVAGLIGLAAVYGIVRATGETARLGVLAVGFLAFENLTFVHGRIGTLDMLSLAAILVGAWLGLRGRWALAGAACAVGSLVKLTGAFGLLALLIYQAVVLIQSRRGQPRRLGWADLRPTLLLVSAYAVVAIAGLWALDLRFSGYGDPWAHLVHMMSFGAALQTSGAPDGIASNPWQWLVNEGQINYLRVAVDTKVGEVVTATAVKVDFRGALNPVLLGALPLAFLFTFWYAWRKGSLLAIWCLAWAAANYLPYYPLAILSHRIMYLYYFLPTIPALAVAVAILLARSGLPRMVVWGYVAAFMLAFVALFPFRALPG